MPQKIELARVVAAVRAELLKANDEAFKVGDPLMGFEGCVFEFAVELAEELGVGLKAYFLQLGAKQKKSDANTVTIRYRALKKRGIVAKAGALNEAAEKITREGKKTRGTRQR